MIIQTILYKNADDEDGAALAVDFRQSYIADQIGQFVVQDMEIAEDSLLQQIDRVEAFKLQVNKFQTDLNLVPGNNMLVSKTLSNMQLLEKDIGKLNQSLRTIRVKIQDEEILLQRRVQALNDSVENLKDELQRNLDQLSSMNDKNLSLERTVKTLTEAAKSNLGQNADLIVQNMRVELSELSNKVDDLEHESRNLRKELESKDKQLYEKQQNVNTLNEELDKLLEQSDETLRNNVRNSIRQSIIDSSDDEADPNLPDELQKLAGMKKQQLINLNIQLKKEYVSAKEQLASSEDHVSSLKMEIGKLKSRLEDATSRARESIGQDFSLDPNLLNMRNSDMLTMFKQLHQEVSKIDQEKQETVDAPIEEPTEQSKMKVNEKNKYVTPEYIERIVEVPVEVIVEKTVEVIVEVPVEIRLDDKERSDLNRKIDLVKSESAGKDLMVSRAKERALELEKKLEAEVKHKDQLQKSIDDLNVSLKNQSGQGQSQAFDGPKQEQVDNTKKELEIMKSNIQQLNRELEWYKKNSKTIAPETETREMRIDNIKPLGHHASAISAEGRVEHANVYPESIKQDPQEAFHRSNMAIQKSLVESKIMLDPTQAMISTEETSSISLSKAINPIYESQVSFSRKKSTEVMPTIALVKADIPSVDLTASTITRISAANDRLDKIEAGLTSLAQSQVNPKQKIEKNPHEVNLRKMNKEFAILQIRLKEIKSKLQKNDKLLLEDRAELEHAELAKVEEKVIENVRQRIDDLNKQQDSLQMELKGCSDIEGQLMVGITQLLGEIEKAARAGSQTDGKLESTLLQSKIFLEDKKEDPSHVNLHKETEAVGHVDHTHLEVPHISQTQMVDQTATTPSNRISAQVAQIQTQPQMSLISKTDTQVIRINKKKNMSEKLSSLYLTKKT